MSEETYVKAADGMLAYLVGKVRPELADRIRRTGRIETAVIGLGRQGTRHAGLMKAFGTTVAAAVAPGRGGTRVHETIDVYDSVAGVLEAHPDVAAASIWKHHSTAADAAIEAVEAGIPVVVLITEGVPVRDVRKVVTAARRHGTLVLGPNTPGVIFPPERVKVGMLPDVFHPAEPHPGTFSAEGVTICSRSGAILYHLSDALASAGIAQNAVIGVGGDAVVGSPFHVVVPLAMGYPGTHLVVVAGEIGGCQEEMLAEDMKAHPERYPKPMVALISGRCAPQGKTMGHAGAIVSPGTEYGTYESKRAALEAAGVTVVNSQRALMQEVWKGLSGRTYFEPERYYERMRKIWEAPPGKPAWHTAVTDIAPNRIVIRGRPIAGLIGKRSLLEVAALLVTGDFPDGKELARLGRLARKAASEPVTGARAGRRDDVSRQLAGMMLADARLAAFEGSEIERTVYCLGRSAAYLARIFGVRPVKGKDFASIACRAVTGRRALSTRHARMIEGAIVASVDHGVTPPSTQATIVASSVRAAFEVCIAAGVGAITDVHGGAGAKAATFFAQCAALAADEGISLRDATEKLIAERTARGTRIEGLGHRFHTLDPRRDVLWRLAGETKVAGDCVAISKVVSDAFKAVRGMALPVNVDGVIGAVVADMTLDPRVAKAVFVFGRIAGLAAHHFEEVATQPPMRRIEFSQAVYRDG